MAVRQHQRNPIPKPKYMADEEWLGECANNVRLGKKDGNNTDCEMIEGKLRVILT
jgi:hypothetical protein